MSGSVSEKHSEKGVSSGWLIALCWLVYALSYIGKLSYTANVTQIEEYFSVQHSDAGAVTSFFFFAYGAGQIINGLLCKKYPLRYVIFGAMAVSGMANLSIPLIPTEQFFWVKYIWMLNGLALSVLWPSLVRLLAETLCEKDLSTANVVMGTTVCTGTFLTYGGSALFVGMGGFQAIFYVAAAISLAVAGIWFFAYPKLVTRNSACLADKPAQGALMGSAPMQSPAVQSSRNGWFPMQMLPFLSVIAVLAVCNNLIKDGLTTWLPAILKETYDLPDWTSILLTMLLPLLGVFAVVVATGIYKKIPNFFVELVILYGVSGILVCVVLGLLSTNALAVTVGCFGIVAMMMSAVNGVITSMIPLYMREKLGNSGMIAGVLNGFCYVGSTISSYGLGALAEGSGWTAVFVLFIVLCAFSVLLGGAGAIVQRRKQDARQR